MTNGIFILALTFLSTSVFAARPSTEFVPIPSGTYWIGCDSSRDLACLNSEKRGSFIEVPAFQIGKFEVTQAKYDQCIQAKKCTKPTGDFQPKKHPANPVTHVTWFQADKYCQWSGGRLPTETEWEISARGSDTRIYPWGDKAPDCKTANSSYLCNVGVQAVGTYEKDKSPFGVYDVAGNVEEWVSDWYGQNFSGEKVVRGGSFRSDAWHSRITHRFYALPTQPSKERGFRCASSQ